MSKPLSRFTSPELRARPRFVRLLEQMEAIAEDVQSALADQHAREETFRTGWHVCVWSIAAVAVVAIICNAWWSYVPAGSIIAALILCRRIRAREFHADTLAHECRMQELRNRRDALVRHGPEN